MTKLFSNIKENFGYLFLIPVFVGLLWFQYIPLLIGILVVCILAIRFGEKIIVVFTIIAFLTLTSSLSSEMRNIVQIGNLVGLLFLFIKNYGLDYKNYAKPPKQILALVFSYFFILVFAIICSKYSSIGIPHLFRSISFFVFIYLYFALLSKYEDVYLFLVSFVLIGLFFGGILFYQFLFTGFSIFSVNDEYLVQLKAFYVHKNTMGSFFTIAIVFSFMLLNYLKDKKTKYAVLLILILFIVGLIITNSRASIIALLISVGFILYYINRKAILYGIIAVLSLIPLVFIESINSLISLYLRLDSIAAGRDKIYDVIFATLPHIWLFGAGPGAAKFYMFDYYPYLMGSPEQLYWDYYSIKADFGHAHNYYLFYFTDLGILGFVFSIVLQYIFIKMGLRCIKAAKQVSLKYYYICLSITAVGVTYFVRGFFEYAGILSYGFVSIDLPFWLIFCLLAFLYQKLIINKNTSFEKK
ncbi:MAG: O-antigen ligase family protein [bacterium]